MTRAAFVAAVLSAVVWTTVAVAPAEAGGIVDLVVSGNEASATVSVLGLEADLTIAFEQVVGLTPANLGLSARRVKLLELVGRLPSSLTSLATGLPILISIEPPAAGGLSFSGVTTISIHTDALHFVADCPLRLFAASTGGPFVDITDSMGMGSYRARGSRGDFSEFLIVADLRPKAAVASLKLGALQDLFTEHAGAISAPLAAELEALLGDAEADWADGDALAAAEDVEAFAALVKAHSGSDVPDVWRSARDLENVAGKLRAAASTLVFSLRLVSSGA